LLNISKLSRQKPFERYTPTLSKHGSCASQDGTTIACYDSIIEQLTINQALSRYTTTESKLLSIIVETMLKEHSLTHSDYDHKKLSYRCIQQSI